MSKFKVLWIDDQKVKMKKDVKAVERVIEYFGFEPEIVLRDDITGENLYSDDSTLKKAFSSRDIDLYVIDYNLKDNLFGTEVVEEIRRSNDIYTDIVFYSSMPDSLINAVKKSFDSSSIMDYCDGVYIAPLGDEFTEKIRSVINKIIKSWYNVHSIRGVLLSKASKFEQMVSSIISQNYKTCLPTIKKVLSEKGRNVCNTQCQKWKMVDSKDDPIQSILNDPISFNWAVKSKILEVLINENAVSIPSIENIKRVFDLRNDFAHNPMHIKQGQLVLKKVNGEVRFSEERIEEIRGLLVTIENDLQNAIKSAIDAEIVPASVSDVD